MFAERIDSAFIRYAADLLGHTNRGLSGQIIISEMTAYAAEYGVQIPFPELTYAGSKRNALYENLKEFSGEQQYRIISELAHHASFSPVPNKDRTELVLRLAHRYPQFASLGVTEVNESLVEETIHWLNDFPEALSLYNEAMTKYGAGVFSRNVLDDLRLSLERLLRDVLENKKSLENQLSALGGFIKEKGGSKELGNMFQTLVSYYTTYQNSYVKHDDAVIEQEIEFVIEITSSFMKLVVRLHHENG